MRYLLLSVAYSQMYVFLFYFSKLLSGIHKATESSFLICIVQICDRKQLKYFMVSLFL